MKKLNVKIEDIKRIGDSTIDLGQNLIALETWDGTNKLTIKHRGGAWEVKIFEGGSLMFNDPLTDEDKKYLRTLANS